MFDHKSSLLPRSQDHGSLPFDKGYIIGHFVLNLSHRGLLCHSFDRGCRDNVLLNQLMKFLSQIDGLTANLGCCAYSKK